MEVVIVTRDPVKSLQPLNAWTLALTHEIVVQISVILR